MPGSLQVTATPVTILAHLLFIAVTTLVLVWLLHFREGVAFNSSNKIKILNLHPLLMVVGFVLVGGEAIMIYKSVPGKRRSLKVVHLLFHLIALAAGVLGIVAVFKFKKEQGLPNMFTLHSWLGMSTICSFGLQYIFAFFAYFFPGAEMYTRATLLPWHRFIGMVTFLLAVGTAEMCLVEYFQFLGLFRNQEALIVNFTGLLLFLFAVFYIFAFFAYFFPGAEMYTRATLLPWHRFIGMVTFLLAVGTAEMCLVEYFQFLGLFRNQEALIVNFTGLLLFLFAVFVSLSSILPRH